jgi:hypothetical protein
MVVFQCHNCSNTIFFENTVCENCGNNLGFLEKGFSMISKSQSESFNVGGLRYGYCQNFKHNVCNWLVESTSTEKMCTACEMNRTIPDLRVFGNIEKWRQIEIAKHRLIYGLLKLGLTIVNRKQDSKSGLCFDFKGKKIGPQGSKSIKTGHFQGIITLDINEADPVHREYMKVEMDEQYRTLLGHFRHEIGHYYWQILVQQNNNTLQEFRSLFGDEQKDYNTSLKNYYRLGAPTNWNSNYISEYASSHPWEDWAETWAHYLHLIDTLETAFSYGLAINPRLYNSNSSSMSADFDPYIEQDFNRIIEAYVPLSSAVNSINRSMGLADLYPFTFNTPVMNKFRFIHRLIK